MVIRYLDIHLETMNDKGEKLKELLNGNVPVVLSIAPYTLREGWYDSQQLDLIRKVVTRPDSMLGQHGNTHRCKYEHKWVDPWHEDECPYYGSDASHQLALMIEGKRTLEEVFHISPQIYVSPNHLSNFTALNFAMQMDYGFFAVKGMTLREPLRFRNGIWVVPETNIKQNGSLTYIHYDKIEKYREAYNRLTNCADPLTDIDTPTSRSILQPNVEERIAQNMRATKMWKIARDIRNFPWRVLRR
jgi:hypothetical protein